MATSYVGKNYVLARNGSGRPTLQHEVARNTTFRFTKCGIDITHWSLAWQSKPIEPLLCHRCGKL